MCSVRRFFHRAMLIVAYKLLSAAAGMGSVPALCRMKLRLGIALLALGPLSACAGAQPETESPKETSDSDDTVGTEDAVDTDLLEEVICYDPVEVE